MCYAIPGRVETIRDKVAIIDYFGQRKRAINELHDLIVGEYVYAQGGYVVEKVPFDQVRDILAAWETMFVQLQAVDAQLSQRMAATATVSSRLTNILDRACAGKALTNDEMLYLIGLEQPAELELFFKAANFIRQKHHQNACCTHGIIEIANTCTQACHYCGIATGNTGLTRYRMTMPEILESVGEAITRHGFRAIVLQSGEGAGYSVAELAAIVREIKKRFSVLVVVSFGEIGLDGLAELFAAGARGMLMRFETSNAALYRQLRPGHELETRLAHIREAYRIGYFIMTGALVGLPGQSPHDMVNDIELTGELHAEMFSFGPFLPHPATPLAALSAPSAAEMLKVLALARLRAPADAKIVVTTAFETLSATARRDGLLAGANSLMLNVTPLNYRKLYAIYPHRAHEAEDVATQVREAVALLASLGRVPMDLGIGAQ